MALNQLTIPMFPLNITLLPGETKTLHIFEERYKQLVSECIENDAHFGIPFVHQKEMGNYGIEVKISNVIKRFDNGEMDIVIEGVNVFKLIEFTTVLSPKLYGAGTIVPEPYIETKPSQLLQDLVREYMWVSQQNAIPMDAFDNADFYSIARLIDLSSVEKYELMKAATAKDKETFLKTKIRLFSYLIKTESELQAKFILN